MQSPSFPVFPSLLAFDFTCLAGQIAALEDAGAAGFHFDIMDGQFVPNLTFGPMVMRAMRPYTPLPFWAHLMVYTPEALINEFAAAGANRLYVHPESTAHIHRALSQVREAGLEAGVAINPGTPLCVLEPLLDIIDGVLLMSVNPGFGGQPFLPSTYDRLHQLRTMLDRAGSAASLECDGGIHAGNIALLMRAGMTAAVVGSALFVDHDPGGALEEIHAAVAAV